MPTSRPPPDLAPMLRALWQQASAPRHFVQDAAQALARLDRIDAAWQRSAPMREVPLGALLASPLAASQLPLGRASTQALRGLAGTPAQDEADPAVPARLPRQATAPTAAATSASTLASRSAASSGAPRPIARGDATTAARRHGAVPPRPAAGPHGPISAAAAATTWAQRVAAAGLGQAMAQVVQRPALASPLATGLGTALAQTTPPPRGGAIAQALRDAGIAAPAGTPGAPADRADRAARAAGGHHGGRPRPPEPHPAAVAPDEGAAATRPAGFADFGQALLDVMQRLPTQQPAGAPAQPRRSSAPAPQGDPSRSRAMGEAPTGADQAFAAAAQATLAPLPGAVWPAPALGTGGLRGLAARASAASATAPAAAPMATRSGRTPAPEADAAASQPPAAAAALDDDDLTQRLTRVLQREARRDGIDLDDVSP